MVRAADAQGQAEADGKGTEKEEFVASRFRARRGATIKMNPVHREMNYFSVTEDELESLYTAGNYKTLDVSMFSLALGIFVALAVTVATVDIPDVRVHAAIWAALMVAGIFSVYFGFRAVIAWQSAARTFKSIKNTAHAQ